MKSKHEKKIFCKNIEEKNIFEIIIYTTIGKISKYLFKKLTNKII